MNERFSIIAIRDEGSSTSEAVTERVENLHMLFTGFRLLSHDVRLGRLGLVGSRLLVS